MNAHPGVTATSRQPYSSPAPYVNVIQKTNGQRSTFLTIRKRFFSFLPSTFYLSLVMETQMGFQRVALLPSQGSFSTPHFIKSVIEVKATGQLGVIKMWLVVSKGMLSVGYLRSNKTSFCVCLIFRTS